MVRADRKRRIPRLRHHADRHDAHHVADDRQRNRQGEEHAATPPGRLREIAVTRRQRHQRENRPKPAARIRDVDDEHLPVHDQVRQRDDIALTGDLHPEAGQDPGRHRAHQNPQMHRDQRQERRKRHAEQQEERREEDALRRLTSEDGPRHQHQQRHEREKLEPHLKPASAQQADEQHRQQPGQRPRRRRAERAPQLLPLRPEDVKREERHIPAKRKILLRRGKYAGQMTEQHRPEPDGYGDERPRQHPKPNLQRLVFHYCRLLYQKREDISKAGKAEKRKAPISRGFH